MKASTHSFLGLSMAVGSLLTAPAFASSSFSEVRNVLQDRAVKTETAAEQSELDVYRAGQLPHYRVDASTFVVNGVNRLLERAKKTVSDSADYYPRLTKFVHPNGICFTGEWVINEPSQYTGYFANGKRGLFVGRASVAMTETEAGHKRGFGFAGKIFPTENTDESVTTANFFTVDVLMGTKRPLFAVTALTNEPETGFDFDPRVLWLGAKIAKIFSQADENPGFRPLYPVAQLGLSNTGSVRTPHWMRLQPDAATTKTNQGDFRNELNIQRFHPNGIRLNIAVSDSTKDAAAETGWQNIGYIQLKESFVSYGCDRQLHFAHPKLK